jgi:hypothetical protein
MIARINVKYDRHNTGHNQSPITNHNLEHKYILVNPLRLYGFV